MTTAPTTTATTGTPATDAPAAAATITGGEAIIRTLIAHGIDTAFCVPGESYLAVLEGLRVHDDRIRLLVHRHETGAACAAEAWARARRLPGIAMVTRGPGASNAAHGVHVAAQDSTPLVLMVGQVATAEYGLEAFQEVDYTAMFGQAVKAVIEPRTAADCAGATARALRIAMAGRPGPVILVLPEDVTEGLLTGDAAAALPDISQGIAAHALDLAHLRAAAGLPGAAAVIAAAAALSQAARPIIIGGEIAAFDRAHGALDRLARLTGAGLATAFRRQDLVPADHPAWFGHLGLGRSPAQKRAFAEADLILIVGSRLDDITTEGWTMPAAHQTVIHLYPDADAIARAAGRQMRLPAHLLVGDITASLDALSDRLADTIPPADRINWRDAIHGEVTRFAADPVRPVLGAVDMAAVVMTTAGIAGPDAAVAIDAGNFAGFVHRYWPFTRPDTQFATQAGAMGYGLPAGLGAAAADHRRPVVVFAGDGGFMMTGQELATAVLERLPVKVIVVDNGVYGTILMHQTRRIGRGRDHGVVLSRPDFAMLARAYGAAGFTVERTEDFAEAFRAALAHDGPALVHVKTDPRDISAYGPLP